MADANRELVRRAARSHGVATAQCLRDYYRMHTEARRSRRSRSWSRPASCSRSPSTAGTARRTSTATRACRAAWTPERCSARSTRWSGSGTAPSALFDFHYRIEIYVPGAQRVHGYYVLPFLLGDRIVARVDLKADRAAGRLLVKAAYAEPGAPAETAEELDAELRRPRRLAGPSTSRSSRGATSLPLLRRLTSCSVAAGNGVVLDRLGRVAAARPNDTPGVDSRACHPRQDPPHRRGQDPSPARGGRRRPSTPSRTTSSR